MGQDQSRAPSQASPASAANGTCGAHEAGDPPGGAKPHEDAVTGVKAASEAVDGAEPSPAKTEGAVALDGSYGVPSETEILAKLVTHLGQRPTRSLALAEIREQLPPTLRPLAEDTNNVRRWLQNFPGLLELEGPPGEEVVCLTVGKPLRHGGGGGMFSEGTPPGNGAAAHGTAVSADVTADGGASAPARSSASEPSPAPLNGAGATDATGAPGTPEKAGGGGAGPAPGDDEEGMNNPATVQLRGLPFRATVAEIKAFLGPHTDNLISSEPSIRLLLNRDGRPSGFARVQFVSADAAHACRQDLHKELMGDRYVEVLACNERDRKAKNRRGAEAGAADNGPIAADGTFDAAERDRVLQECREHMRQPGRHQLLLSMLGIALSAPSRNYLRKVNLGLKHFLARVPHEFRVEGPKGCEKVLWTGAGSSIPSMNNPEPSDMGDPITSVATGAVAGNWEPQTPKQTTPLMGGKETNAHSVLATPSDWGTPGVHHQSQVGAQAGAAAVAAAAGQAGVDGWAGYGWPPYSSAMWPPWPDQMAADALGATAAAGAAQRAAPSGARTASSASALGKRGSRSESSVARSHAHLHPQSHPFAHSMPGAKAAAVGEGDTGQCGGPPMSKSCLRLRGLPFSMTVQDVLAFVAQHEVADRIADVPNAAVLLPKANGRPSGQAVIQMRSRFDAEVAQRALFNQWIQGRYIEVFVYGDEDGVDVGASLGVAAGGPGTDMQGSMGFAGAMGATDPSIAGLGWRPGVGANMQWDLPPWGALVPPPVPGAGVSGATGDGEDPWSSLFNFLEVNNRDGMQPDMVANPGDGGPATAPAQADPPRGTLQV